MASRTRPSLRLFFTWVQRSRAEGTRLRPRRAEKYKILTRAHVRALKMQSKSVLILFMTVFSVATQTLGIILSKLCSTCPTIELFSYNVVLTIGNSMPENGSIIWLSTSGDTETRVLCEFNISETTRGNVQWFLNGKKFDFSDSSQFTGVKSSVRDPPSQSGGLASRLILEIVATNSKRISYLHDGNITCLPPGGTVFGLFRTFVTGIGQFTELHTRCVRVLSIVCPLQTLMIFSL